MWSLLKEVALTGITVHDAEYRQSEKDWYSFVEKVTERLMTIDDTIPELPVKDIVSPLRLRLPA